MFEKHFNIDLISSFDKDINYYFNDKNNVYLLVLKFEDIKNWTEIKSWCEVQLSPKI